MAEFNIICSSQKGDLTVNYEELKQQLELELKKYDYEVTEDLIKQAKSDKALINKFAKAIDDKRKEKKAEYCEPLVEFESKMNTLRDMAKEGYNKINIQIKAFEEKEKEDKKVEIEMYYSTTNIVDLIPFEKIFDIKWLNKGCTDWKKQLDEKVDRINQELYIINSFGLAEDEKLEIKGYYLETLNLTSARNQFDIQKQRREALKKQQENVQKQDMPLEASHSYVEEPQETEEQVIEKPKKQRIKAEFVATRDFYDEMNILIKKYRPQVRILEREDVE